MTTDEDLVGDLAQGDEQALRELLRRYQRPLSNFIYRHTGGCDVEDLYQETWLRVVRQASRFDPARRFSTWIYQIAVNLCRDWHRRLRPELPLLSESAATAPEVARAEARLDAARLLARLSEPQREVVILRIYHDLSEEEVATILGCPKGTVKSRMHSALARLTAMVQEEGP